MPENVTVGLDVEFKCQHPSAFTITWRINGSSVGANPPPDITIGNIRDEDHNLVYTLTVIALFQYNNTVVECVAVFFNDTTQTYTHETTPPVTLTIKGKNLVIVVNYA